MTIRGTRLIALMFLGLLLPACSVGGGGTLTPTVAPAIPSAVTASPGNHRATIRWSSPTTGAVYTIKRSLTSGGPYFPVSGGTFSTPTSYVDLGLDNGTSYFYVVAASNQFGSSSDSAEVQATPGFKPLSASSGPTAYHNLAILPDRTLWSWGSNNKGQLGNGLRSGATSSPVAVLNLEDVTAASAGQSFSLALLKDGSVWAWGENSRGNLGNGTNLPTIEPVPHQVPNLGGVVALSAGGAHALALTNDGTVWSWGDNTTDQLGNGGSGGYSPTPTPVPGLTKVKAISAGMQHCLAIRQDGSVWAWGANNSGKLGTGPGSPGAAATPVQVPNLTSFVAVAVGGDHSLALRSDGSVWSWGSNISGQLGIGTAAPASSPSPLQVPGLTEIREIAAGFGHSYALRSDGSLWAWGSGIWSQLGNGSAGGSLSPVKVLNVGNVVAVGSGLGHGLCLDDEGALRCWGDNTSGCVGNGTGWTHDFPIPVPNLTGMVSVSASSFHSAAVRNDGTVWAWGKNNHGQVGFNGPPSTGIASPGQVPGITGVTAVATGTLHTLALKGDGSVWGWGYNADCELGQGAPSADVTSPVKVPVLANITAIAAGRVSGLAIRNDGTVWQWGDVDWGGSMAPIVTPAQVPVLTGIIAIAGGFDHALALKNDGTVWAWGANTGGQLNGTPSGTSVATPVQVPGLSGAIAISGGNYCSFAVKSDGSLWAWGTVSLNGGTPSIGTGPGPVQGISSATKVSGGFNFTLVLLGDGSAWSWGVNDFGQLATGDESDRPAPVATQLSSGAARVSAGEMHALALMSDGTLTGWGRTSEGQIGVPMFNFVPIPALVAP